MQGLFEELDLVIYPTPLVPWWSNSLYWGGVVALLSVIFVFFMFFRLKVRRRPSASVLDTLTKALKKGMIGVEQGRISVSDGISVLTSVLKAYTAWLSHDISVRGMTDQQWLSFVKTVDVLQPYIQEFEKIIAITDEAKFNYVQVSQKQLLEWCDSVINIMCQVNSDMINNG